MRFFLSTLIIVSLFFHSCIERTEETMNDITFTRLLCDYEENPAGIDNLQPRLSWIMNSNVAQNHQTAWQVLVASTPFLLEKDEGDIWDSGKVVSGNSVHIPYEGPDLRSQKKYYWKVRIWDKSGNPSKYSQTAMWETGILDPSLWKADWISAPRLFDWSARDQRRKVMAKDAPPENEEPSPIFRKEFTLDSPPKMARAYISGLGYYELYINGRKVGDNVLDPAFTAYDKKVLYATYDITDYLTDSLNAVGVMLGNGWYNMFSRGVWSFDRAPWRADPAFRLQVSIAGSQGLVEQILSDTSWSCRPGPVTFNSIRQGEVHDATREQPGWSRPGFFDENWHPVRKVRGPSGKMQAQQLPPIRILERLEPVKIYKTSAETVVCDFGQNLAGFIELSLNTQPGKKIEFKYGEKLHADGTVDQSNIDGLVADMPFQTDVYITRGGGREEWHPRFTYHGFRYVEVKGFPEMALNNIRACLISTSMKERGTFQCSNELLNQIQENAEWSFRSNFHGYPTDCPQREKNGWTGDAQLASDMALYNYHVETSYRKWVDDIVDSQLPSGMVSAIVPTGGWGYYWGNGPAWDYALIILPWKTYVYSGDVKMLKDFYDPMKRYMDFLSTTAEDYIIRWGLGDWVPAKTVTPPDLITTAYYYQDAVIMGRIAEILGHEIDVNHFRSLASNIKTAFNNTFVDREALLVGNGSQTSLGCALHFRLLDTDIAADILEKLSDNVSQSTMNLDFGVLGSKFVPRVLADMGKIDIAYQMINTTDYPGWGNWISRGATTLWEDWQGEGSRNHIFFGDVSAWFYTYLGGLRPDEQHPGFKRFTIQPHFPDDLNWVNARMESMYGLIESNWERDGQEVILDLQIPFNTSAIVRLPSAYTPTVVSADNEPMQPEISIADDSLSEMTLLSGKYTIEFTVPE